MDYGNTPNFELDNFNLDTNEWQNTTPGRDPRAIGNRIISTPENSPFQTPDQLGEVVPSMPPGYEQPGPAPEAAPGPEMPPAPSNAEIAVPAIDEAALKTEDRLDPRAVKVVDEAIHKLNQDGNIADFYDTARNMMETNLENSYNRKLAA